MCYCGACSYYACVTFRSHFSHKHTYTLTGRVHWWTLVCGHLDHSICKGCISSVLSLEPLVKCECGAF